MAIGWLSVLQMVPWGDVIKNAPKVADSAKKLWDVTRRSPPLNPPTGDSPALPRSPEALAIDGLQQRVAALENETRALHEQMLASSELINTLAEQNTQLVARAEVSRRRLLMLSGVSAASVVAIVLLAFFR